MDNKKIAGVMALTVFLTAIGTGFVTYDGTTYYCESTDQICIGTSLSSSSKTCYYLNENGTQKEKRCLVEPYWQVFKNQETKASKIEVFANGCLHICPTEKGRVNSYTVCECESGEFAYLGELI